MHKTNNEIPGAKSERHPPGGKMPLSPELISDLMVKAAEASEFLKALSHETRLATLCLLSDGEKTVGELEAALQLPQAIVSQQLARLRADDIVRTRRDGRQIHYSITRPEVVTLVQALHAMFCPPYNAQNDVKS